MMMSMQALEENRMRSDRVASDIERRLQEHLKWLESSGGAGEQFVANGENLAGIRFHDVNIRGAFFIDCNLDFTSFANLSDSEHSGSPTAFRDCSFRHATFNSSSLSGVGFTDCIFFKTNFKRCNLPDSRISSKPDLVSTKIIIEAMFTDSNLDRSQISNFGLGKSIVVLAPRSMKGAHFENCEIGENFTHSEVGDMDDAEFISCMFTSNNSFVRSSGSRIKFSDCTFDGGGAFIDSNLRNVSFSRCTFDAAAFSGGEMAECLFSSCSLLGAYFRDCGLDKANFSSCLLDGAKFDNARMSEGVFWKCSITEAKFDKAIFVKSDLRQCDFSRCDFHNARIEDCDMSASTFIGANLNDGTESFVGTNFSGAQWAPGEFCAPNSIGGCYGV